MYNHFSGCNRTYSGDYGRIMSPRWPRRVRRGTVCTFTIEASQGKTITLYFARLGIVTRPNCTGGSLQVRLCPIF